MPLRTQSRTIVSRLLWSIRFLGVGGSVLRAERRRKALLVMPRIAWLPTRPISSLRACEGVSQETAKLAPFSAVLRAPELAEAPIGGNHGRSTGEASEQGGGHIADLGCHSRIVRRLCLTMSHVIRGLYNGTALPCLRPPKRRRATQDEFGILRLAHVVAEPSASSPPSAKTQQLTLRGARLRPRRRLGRRLVCSYGVGVHEESGD